VLRTQEKYGYIVGSSNDNVGDSRYLTKYYTFTVQSPHKSAIEIIDRTKTYIVEFKNVLSSLTDNDFDNLRNACISLLLSPFRNLEELSHYVFNQEIETEYTTFDLRKILLQTYRTLTRDDLLIFYDEKFINMRSLAVGIDSKLK
jgi:secreted Zn-dependent insulinase-like peptidase